MSSGGSFAVCLIYLLGIVFLFDIFLRRTGAKFCGRWAGADIKALDVFIFYEHRCPDFRAFYHHNSASLVIFEAHMDKWHNRWSHAVFYQINEMKADLVFIFKTVSVDSRSVPSSVTPIVRIPPLVLRNPAIVLRTASSILGSLLPVCWLTLKVDLNSTSLDSPLPTIVSIDRGKPGSRFKLFCSKGTIAFLDDLSYAFPAAVPGIRDNSSVASLPVRRDNGTFAPVPLC